MRRYRIVQERTRWVRWVVLGESLLADDSWVDIAKFHTEKEAKAYVRDVLTRQRDIIRAEGHRTR